MAVPTLDSLLVPFSTNWNTRTVASPSDFDLSVPEVAAYTAVHTPYIAAAAACESDGAKSQSLVAVRKAAKAALLAYARELYAFVQASRSVSDGNKLLLNITLRSLPTPTPVPSETPILEVGNRFGTTVELKAHGAHSAHARPVGVQTMTLFTHVGPTPPPGGSAAWTLQGTSSKTRVGVTFAPDTAPGTVVWFTAYWSNRKGENGAACSPISAIIAGGGATVIAV